MSEAVIALCSLPLIILSHVYACHSITPVTPLSLLWATSSLANWSVWFSIQPVRPQESTRPHHTAYPFELHVCPTIAPDTCNHMQSFTHAILFQLSCHIYILFSLRDHHYGLGNTGKHCLAPFEQHAIHACTCGTKCQASSPALELVAQG